MATMGRIEWMLSSPSRRIFRPNHINLEETQCDSRAARFLRSTTTIMIQVQDIEWSSIRSLNHVFKYIFCPCPVFWNLLLGAYLGA